MTLKELIGKFLGEIILDDIQERAEDTLEDAKEKAKELGEYIVKKILVLFLLILGTLFGLVGIGWFLTAKVPAFSNGIGFIIVGLFIILMGMLAGSQKNSKK